MTKDLWLNLPVKDLNRSRAFFTALGFTFHPRHDGSNEMAGLVIGEKNTMVMLVPEPTFEGFCGHTTADTSRGTEVLISCELGSRAEVDALAGKVEPAGGTLWGKPSEVSGWMYGCGFSDPDGHRWNVLFMDWSRQNG